MRGHRLLGMKNFRALDDGKNKNVKLVMSFRMKIKCKTTIIGIGMSLKYLTAKC